MEKHWRRGHLHDQFCLFSMRIPAQLRKALFSLAAIAVLAAGNFVYTLYVEQPVVPSQPGNKMEPFFATTTAYVKRVVDGDTIELDNGEKVRYIGVNTPESVDPRKAVECFGKEASEYNAKLVAGRKVGMVGDVGDTDKYGRLLRYVYLEDGTFVNLKLVQDGYASVMTVPPNVLHQQDFVDAERDARGNKWGLWGACK